MIPDLRRHNSGITKNLLNDTFPLFDEKNNNTTYCIRQVLHLVKTVTTINSDK